MNMKKKLMSILVAAAMTVSSFTAFAATDVYTLTDGNATGWTMANGTVETKKDEGSDDAYLRIQGGGSGNRTLEFALPTEAQLTGKYTIEFDTMIEMRGNGMGRIGHATQIAFKGSSSATDVRDGANIKDDYNAANGTNYKEGSGSGAMTDVALKIDVRPYLKNQWVINDYADALELAPANAVTVPDGNWVRVQAAVDADAKTAVVNAIDKGGNKLIDAKQYTCDISTLKSIYVVSNRGDNGSGAVCLDNIHIYAGEAEELTTEGLKGQAIATPEPTPIATMNPNSAPTLKAHATAVSVYEQNFNGVAVDTGVTMGATGTENFAEIEGMLLNVGGRDDTSTDTYARVTKKVGTDNVMTIAGGQYSTMGRGARVALADELSIAEATSNTAIMGAAFQLSSSKVSGGNGKLYLVDNNTNLDGNNVARDVLAVISTEEDVSGYANGDTAIGISVSAGEWHTVAVAVSADKYRVYIDGDYENPVVQGTKVGTGETSVAVTDLPFFAATNGKDTSYSLVNIDNIVAYQIESSFEKKYLPAVGAAPEPEEVAVNATIADATTVNADVASETAAVVKATQNDDGTFAVEIVKGLTAGDNTITWTNAPVAGDKIMVFQSLKSIVPSALNPFVVQ